MKNVYAQKSKPRRGKTNQYPMRYTVRLPEDIAFALLEMPRLKKRALAREVRVQVVKIVRDAQKQAGVKITISPK